MTKTTFQLLAAANLLFLVVVMVVLILFDEDLPPALAQYVEQEQQIDPAPLDWLGGIVAIAAMVGNAGLLFFARWARPVFVWGTVLCIVLSLGAGPTVSSALSTTASDLTVLFDGILIALVYFSPIREYFAGSAGTKEPGIA